MPSNLQRFRFSRNMLPLYGDALLSRGLKHDQVLIHKASVDRNHSLLFYVEDPSTSKGTKMIEWLTFSKGARMEMKAKPVGNFYMLCKHCM